MLEPDVQVVGAGPAGATAARLLALWGHRVTLFHRPQSQPANPAESLPPSIATALHLCQLAQPLADAGFARSLGNAVWWGHRDPRIESYPSARTGYHIERAPFDTLLRQLAQQAGAEIIDRAAQADDLHPGFLIDATGRAAMLSRSRREPRPIRTVCLGAIWSAAEEFSHPAHTWVEAHETGWAWSVPLSSRERVFSVMLDADDAVPGIYRQELEKTSAFRHLLAGARLAGQPYACDATITPFARPVQGRHLAIGDAASTIDPLSSFGIKKSLTSAWLAAVAVHTALTDPAREQLALDFFATREHQAFTDAARLTAHHIREAGWQDTSPFWQRRAHAHDPWYQPQDLLAVLDRLRECDTLAIKPSPEASITLRPAVIGNLIQNRPALTFPQLPPDLDYINGVAVATLVPIVEQLRDIPSMHQAYCAVAEPVDLPNFLGALCLLIAKGALLLD